MEHTEDYISLLALATDNQRWALKLEKSVDLHTHLLKLKALGASGIVYFNDKPYKF